MVTYKLEQIGFCCKQYCESFSFYFVFDISSFIPINVLATYNVWDIHKYSTELWWIFADSDSF